MEITIIYISGLLGALITFLLNNKFQLGAVMASAGLSVVAGGYFYFFPDQLSQFLTINIPLVVMGSSFIGMATSKVIRNYWVIGASGLIFSLIYLNSSQYFEGFGGALGTTAAISLGAVYAVDKLLNLVSAKLK